MSITCKRCVGSIPELNLTRDELEKIADAIMQHNNIKIVKWLITAQRMSHGEAKSVVMHFNPVYGKCHRCNNDALEGNHLECPKCKAFNYNLSPVTRRD